MKIGIFTLYGSTNYGGALQAYALSQVLRQQGHDVEIIRHVNDSAQISKLRKIIGILTSYPFSQFSALIKEFISRKQQQHEDYHPSSKKEAFEKFYKENLNFSPRLKRADLPTYISDFDVVITGSDQVWTDVYSSYLPLFFEGLEAHTCKKLSYAACSAHSKAPLYNRNKLRRLINNLDGVSVRDATTQKLINHLGRTKDVSIVSDPTILYPFEEALSKRNKSPYILCYILGGKPKEGHLAYINHIRQAHGNLPIVAVSTSNPSIHPYVDTVLDSAGPFEWVDLIAHATCVYTDSFHAVIFSLKFHTPFIAFYSDPVRSSRLIDLKKTYGLERQIVNKLVQAKVTEEINWPHIDQQISLLVTSSKRFLSTHIKES